MKKIIFKIIIRRNCFTMERDAFIINAKECECDTQKKKDLGEGRGEGRGEGGTKKQRGGENEGVSASPT